MFLGGRAIIAKDILYGTGETRISVNVLQILRTGPTPGERLIHCLLILTGPLRRNRDAGASDLHAGHADNCDQKLQKEDGGN
jgi:hypothetical protein